MQNTKGTGRVLGLGGVFFRSRDPEALSAWYVKWLEMPSEGGYTMLAPADMPPGAYTVWSPFRQETDYFQPGVQDFMINLIVDDVDAALARIAAGGATVLPEREDGEFGRFGWFLDPEGHKVELWQPPPPNQTPQEETSHE